MQTQVFMDSGVVNPAVVKRPTPTPKAILHQKYGTKACYTIEEVQESAENICPGLVLPQQGKCLYKCHLELPDFCVTSDTFARKKDAEQSAAKIAIEKLGIESTVNNPTPEEVWDEIVARVSSLFKDEFLSSSHPLIGHFRAAFERKGNLYGFLPLSIIACDVKISNLCKSVNPKAESDPLLMISLVMKAARSSPICIPDGELWIGKQNVYSPEAIQSLIDRHLVSDEIIELEAVRIPSSTEKPIESLSFDISPNKYYLDEIASKLGVKDSSRVLVSRTVGKASSEMRFYFPAPEFSSLFSDSSLEMHLNAKETDILEPALNVQASYMSGQIIFGDAILATVGYRWKSSSLFHEQVSLSTYYRMLVSRVPAGNYKLCREAIFAAELPFSFTTRSNWRGPSPKDLLCMFCRYHRLSEPLFRVYTVNPSESSPEISKICKHLESSKLGEGTDCGNGEVHDITDNDSNKSNYFRCEVNILSRKQELILEYSLGDIYRKQTDAIQNAALKVLYWLNEYFKQLDMPMEKLFAFGQAHDIHVNTETFSEEFGLCLHAHDARHSKYVTNDCLVGSIAVKQANGKQEKGGILFSIEGPDSGVTPSQGSLVCISYTVELVTKSKCLKETLETKDEFEFEMGTGAVITQLETCVSQMSTNQAASFIAELPSMDLLLAAVGESAECLSQLSLSECALEYSLKVLQVTEPLEDRMEQALFSPPLSKQRVEFAVRCINGSHAKTLIDFGCGSGSLLDSLLDHTTTLEKIVGVDISRKSLTRAAKILHSKLSVNMDTMAHTTIRSVVLYDGSITDFDSRLYEFDIGICLEVIEHMEEDQASLFGDIVLSSFCPRLLIVSTPNYEYNPILQRSSLSNKEEDLEEKSQNAPCKFRNHDHKFEWTREQFESWAIDLASRHSYSVEFSGVGGSGDIEPGFASQIAVFRESSCHQEERILRNVDLSQPYEVIWEWNSSTPDL